MTTTKFVIELQKPRKLKKLEQLELDKKNELWNGTYTWIHVCQETFTRLSEKNRICRTAVTDHGNG